MNTERLYQIYTGRWEEANILNHPAKVLERMKQFEWEKLKQRWGLTHIYLLGLWEVGNKIVVTEEAGQQLSDTENRCPSAFAIVDHAQVSRKLGTETELRDLVDSIHQAGLRVIVDYVANHTGLEHPWRSSHSDWYKPGTAFSGDVMELDYGQTAVWSAMSNLAEQIADFGVDGFRCDMAHLVPTKFWQELITKIKQEHPGFLCIAESYETSIFDHANEHNLLAAGFDAVYDFGLFQNLRDLAAGGSLNNVAAYINYVIDQRPTGLVHYLNNHDDPYPLSSKTYLTWLQLLVALPGMSLIFNGSEGGYSKRLAHHYVELLSKKYVTEAEFSSELQGWLANVNQPGFVLNQAEVVDDGVMRCRWQTNLDHGHKDLLLKEK